jgi:hypothetical protein
VLALLSLYLIPATGSYIYEEVTRVKYVASATDTPQRKKAVRQAASPRAAPPPGSAPRAGCFDYAWRRLMGARACRTR